jgi:hypothetical protein
VQCDVMQCLAPDGMMYSLPLPQLEEAQVGFIVVVLGPVGCCCCRALPARNSAAATGWRGSLAQVIAGLPLHWLGLMLSSCC